MSKLLDDLYGRYIGVIENPEYDQEVVNTATDKIKSCAICGKSFIKNRRAVYCNRQHYTTCVNCGKRIDITVDYFRAGFVPKTCCKTCADLVGAQTLKENCLKKYGVTNPMYVSEYANKSYLNANPNRDLSMRKAKDTRSCEICGKEFTAFHTNPKKCCSVECASVLRAKHISEHVRICKLCGKSFTSNFSKSLYCNGPHYRDCIVCGKSFRLNNPTSIAQCCSLPCKDKLTRQTNLNRYGVEVGSQSVQARKKLSESYQLSQDSRVQTCLHRYGTTNPALSTGVRQKIAATVSTDTCQQKIADTCLTRYGVRHSSQSPEVHRKQWNRRKNIRGCDGLPLDSTWERTVYNFWKSLGLDIERNIPIEFEYEGKRHMTFVDFRVNGILFEVKGNHFLTGGVEENYNFPMTVKLDVYRNNNVVIIAKDCSAPLFEDGTLTGVDLALFEDTSDFPYDAKTRWTIIEYLIRYKKGFIGIKDFQ